MSAAPVSRPLNQYALSVSTPATPTGRRASTGLRSAPGSTVVEFVSPIVPPRPPASAPSPAFGLRFTPSFEDAVLPHLQAAGKLARWLMRDATAAEDVVQDACLKAWQYFGTFGGQDGRAWFMRIVRNVAYTRLRSRRGAFEVELGGDSESDPAADVADTAPDPEEALLASDDMAQLREAVAMLPDGMRQCLELRLFDHLSYEEIAQRAGIPIGTVMSRLARARQRFVASPLAKRQRPSVTDRA